MLTARNPLDGPEIGAEIRAAHKASVEVALGYMQREACWTRRGHGGREFVHGKGYLAAGYLHRSSRAGDPQLHTRVLIANATRGPDGRWTRLYHQAIYNDAKTASYLFEAHLRYELTRRLGVRWREVRNGIARRLPRRASAGLLDPPPGDPRGGGPQRFGPRSASRQPGDAKGRPGEGEIEVGEARFAAGDQVITRINDHRAQIYNRGRWRVAEVTPRLRPSCWTASTPQGG
jgi:TrwC relaxase